MMIQLSGWNRLAIVLCSIWIVGVLATATVEYTLPKSGFFVTVSMPHGLGFSKGQLTTEDGKNIVLNDQKSDKPWEVDWSAENNVPLSRGIHWDNLIYSFCFPFLAWLIAGILAKAIRWVVAGFRDRSA